MDITRFHPLEFRPPTALWRMLGVMVGLTLLWVGSGQISVTGLLVMLSGLVLVVGGIAPVAAAALANRPAEHVR